MKEDSAISCASSEYKTFRAVVILFTVFYQSIPLLWFVLLYRFRHELNPRGQSKESAMLLRDQAPYLQPYSFLFSDCKVILFFLCKT